MTTLTHRDLATLIYMEWLIIGPGNGLVPNRRQAITWTNADLLAIVSLGTNFRERWIEMQKKKSKKNAIENIVCPERPYLLRPKYVIVIQPQTTVEADHPCCEYY